MGPFFLPLHADLDHLGDLADDLYVKTFLYRRDDDALEKARQHFSRLVSDFGLVESLL